MRLLTLLIIAVCAAFAANPFQPTASGRYTPSADARDFRVGFWDLSPFDPLFGEPPLPGELRIGSYPGDGTGYYLVQFSGPVVAGQVRQLAAAGAGFLGFHSRYTAFAKMSSAVAGAVSRLGFVRWVGLYQPGYKFWSGTLQDEGFGRVAVTVFYPEDLGSAARELEEMGFAVVRTGVSEYMKVIEVDCAQADLARIARLGWVMNIEEWHPAEAENEQCQWVAQTWSQNERRVWDQGITGEGEVLGWTDGQVYPNHNAFLDPAVPITDTGEFPAHRKLVVVKKYPPARMGSADSHGTHTGGTIAGNDSVNGGVNANDGHARSARLVQLSPIPQPPGNDFTEPLNTITNYLRNPELRPHTISNSWWTLTMGQYTNAAATFDQFSWKNKDIQTVKSCGNQGHTSTYRITEPGNSKSVISAASLQNGANSTLLSSYSSQGPAPDGRIKPDISIPGENIMSAQSGSSNGYVSMSGTSMAAPATNGGIGLLRNYLRRGYYPSGSANAADTWGYVSAAVLKAMMLVSADPNVESYVVPSDHIGWGRFNLDSVMFFSTPSPDARKLLVDDDTLGLATGEYVEYEFTVTDSTLHLRAGVVWTDTAAAAGANPALINNLDCQLTAPNADVYKGDIYSGGMSMRNPGQPFDNLNPLEMFRVADPAPGTWTLRVSAQNVVTARQPFAVVVTGGIGPASRHDVGVSAIVAPKGVVESGAVVTPACSVHNFGSFVETYAVSMRIGSWTGSPVTVTGQAPGATDYVSWPAQAMNTIGTFAVVCSTGLADANPANDVMRDSVMVRGAFTDVGLVRIIAPADTVDSGSVIRPQIVVENFGTRPAVDFPIFMHIAAMYAESAHATLAAGAVDTVELPEWTANRLGPIWMTAYSALPGDENHANDTLRDTVIVWPPTGVSELAALPTAFALDPASPTLFRGSADIRFGLPAATPVKCEVFSATGALVRTLFDAARPAGFHRATWDGRDGAGNAVSRGIYYCRLSTGTDRVIRKLVKLD